jgi:hypothetical protein
MQIVTHEMGRAIQLIVMEEVRPTDGLDVRDFVNSIAARYQFIHKPDPANESDIHQNGYRFRDGFIDLNGERLLVDQFTVYNDGVVVQCKRTDIAEKVLDEGLNWFLTTFNLRPPITQKPRIYASTLVVDFTDGLENMFKDWGSLQKLLNRSIQGRLGIADDVSLARFAFIVDPLVLDPKNHNSLFLIERRVEVPYSQNRYHCSAPLTTSEHIEFLRELENLSSRN